MFLRSKANWFGICSVALSITFWVYMNLPLDPRNPGGYLSLGLLVTILTAALVSAVLAGLMGSRLWLVAAVGPLVGGMFLLSLRT